MQNDRRDFLKTAAGATALSLLPVHLRAALAHPRKGKTGTIMDVEHVVIFMQENRSFDHYFGTLRGVRGFSDPHPITLPSGKPVWYQPLGLDSYTPFHLDTRTTSAQCMSDLDHSWKGSYDLWKNHDAWIATKTDMTMGYFMRHDIPFYHALADIFTICDAYHCSVFGPTTPNRLHLWAGTSGLTVGHSGQGCVSNPPEYNETADLKNDTKGFKAFTWTTYAERLEAAGIDWKLYQEYDNYGDNGLAYFENFRAPVSKQNRDLVKRGRDWVKGSNAGNAKASRGEHLVAAFAEDVMMDRLPQVSWIVAPYIMCEHPTACPSYGEDLTWQLLDALAANPKVWSKTAFILNYDENDGFFDHMPPAIPPLQQSMGASTVDMTGEDYFGVPFGFGPRVPMLVISPWTVGGFVNSQLFDHTSVLRFLETRFGIQAPNISDWRRAVTGDLTSVFDFTQTGDLGHFRDGANGMKRADRQCKLPAPQYLDEALPVQEHGKRKARSLPYAFDVDGNTVANGFQLDFSNTGSSGATFRVSTQTPLTGPWFFTVGADKTLSYTLPRTGSYDFELHGPNGYYRRFKGSGDEMISVRLQGETVAIHNSGASAVSLTAASAYSSAHVPVSATAGAVASVPLNLGDSDHWYDLTLEGADGYLRHLAGHIETGKASFADPQLG